MVLIFQAVTANTAASVKIMSSLTTELSIITWMFMAATAKILASFLITM